MLLCQYLLIYNMCIVRDYTYYVEISSVVYYLSICLIYLSYIYLSMDIYIHIYICGRYLSICMCMLTHTCQISIYMHIHADCFPFEAHSAPQCFSSVCVNHTAPPVISRVCFSLVAVPSLVLKLNQTVGQLSCFA